MNEPLDIATMAARARAEQADPNFAGEHLRVLDALVYQWGTGDSPRPAGAQPGNISINEWAALAIATQHDREFRQPVAQFLSIPPWLQAWVLKRLRMENHIG